MDIELLDTLPDPIVIFDATAHVSMANSRAERMFGYPRNHLLGQSASILSAGGLHERIQILIAGPQGGTTYNMLLNCLHCDGSVFRAKFNLRAGFHDGQKVVSAIARLAEPDNEVNLAGESQNELETQIFELRKSINKLQGLANLDGLTGLNNRRAFQEKLEVEISRACRYKTPLSLVMMDVDFFKDFNDEYGHPEGDEVLKVISDVLRRVMRVTDFAARYGGEEFAIILPNTDREAAVAMAERFRSDIEHLAWRHGHVTASFGVTTLDPARKNRFAPDAGNANFAIKAEGMIDAADQALYRSKLLGRNRVTHEHDDSVFGTNVNSGRPRPSSVHNESPFVAIKRRAAETWSGQNLLLFLLSLRWLSLLPPLVGLLATTFTDQGRPNGIAGLVFVIAVLNNIALSNFHSKIDIAVVKNPLLLGVDFAICSSFVVFTGGLHSPYFLYAYTPVLAASFFLRVPGGITAATAFTLLYLLSAFVSHSLGATPHLAVALEHILSFYFVALAISHPAALQNRLDKTAFQLENLQHQLARAESPSTVGKIAFEVAREARGPLERIGNWANHLLSCPRDESNVRQYSIAIRDEVQRLEFLLNERFGT